MLMFTGTVHVREDGAIAQVLKNYDKYAYPGTPEQPIVKVWHGLSLEKMDYVGRVSASCNVMLSF